MSHTNTSLIYALCLCFLNVRFHLCFSMTFCSGLLGSEKSFRTSLRKSLPVQEEEEYSGNTDLKTEGLNAVGLSRDNTETEGESLSGLLSFPHIFSYRETKQFLMEYSGIFFIRNINVGNLLCIFNTGHVYFYNIGNNLNNDECTLKML